MYVIKIARELNHISVAQGCGCALLFLPKIKPVSQQYLKPGVFISYCADESETVNVFEFA
jgi:hypothetical protein